MRRARGFTLLEVLIAMSLLTLVMVAVLASMRTLGNTRTTLDQVIERIDQVRSVSGFLRTSIGGALPLAQTNRQRVDHTRSGGQNHHKGGDQKL